MSVNDEEQQLSQDNWNFINDNRFALGVFQKQGVEPPPTSPQQNSALCQRCLGIDFLIDDLIIRDALVDLEMRSSRCDFCRLLFHTWKRYRNEKSTTAGFRKVESRLTMDEHSRTVPVLSICRIPGV